MEETDIRSMFLNSVRPNMQVKVPLYKGFMSLLVIYNNRQVSTELDTIQLLQVGHKPLFSSLTTTITFPDELVG